MLLNNPIFADLSTYSPKKTIPFYEHIFGWKYYKNNDYYLAYLENIEVSGLYETPEKFKQMQMPHFWMTYIHVADLHAIVNKAKQLGGVIEIDYEMSGFGKVALIRDPSGAGFTIYEGNKLRNTRTQKTKNTLIWNELHVSDAQNVIPFYEGIFDWVFKQENENDFKVYNGKNKYIADLLEIPNDYKGKYEYWVCTFGVESLEASKKLILENNGSLISEEHNRLLLTDNSNEAFFYIREV